MPTDKEFADWVYRFEIDEHTLRKVVAIGTESIRKENEELRAAIAGMRDALVKIQVHVMIGTNDGINIATELCSDALYEIDSQLVAMKARRKSKGE